MRLRMSLSYAALSLGCALTLSIRLNAQTASTPPPAAPPSAKRGMNLEDLAKFERVADPQVSPDGAWIAYTVSKVDVGEDKNASQLWMVSWDGKQDVQLTFSKDGASGPQWSPDGKWLAFTSGREGEAKGSQVWVLDRRGGEAQQLTNVKEDLGGFKWSPDSKTLLLTLTEKDEPEPGRARSLRRRSRL